MSADKIKQFEDFLNSLDKKYYHLKGDKEYIGGYLLTSNIDGYYYWRYDNDTPKIIKEEIDAKALELGI